LSAQPKYPLGTIAKLLMLTERRVQQLVKEGHIPRAERGSYELVPVVQAYIRYLRDRGGSDNADAADLPAERARLAKAQADAQEMKNAVTRAELVPASQVVRAVSAVIGACRARLLGIPARAAPQVVGLESRAEVRDVLAAMVREACQELSQRRLDDELGLRAPADGGAADGDGDMGAAAGPDSLSMG
jgi:phage terminase Nu1 subunit (DNA packaging protein)